MKAGAAISGRELANGMRPEVFTAALMAAGAMCQDLKDRRVSNVYLLVCLLAALGVRIVRCTGGAAGPGRRMLEPADMLAGFLVPVILLGWLFFFRMLGAGDIKLLSVLGCLTGARGSLVLVWRSMLFGAVLSAGILYAEGNAVRRFRYLAEYVRRYLTTRRREPYRGAWDDSANLHMTVPILMAVLSLILSGLSDP